MHPTKALPTNHGLSWITASCLVISAALASGQAVYQSSEKFRQLEEVLPTANEFRTASGAPGSKYWQQKVDYIIDVELNDDNQSISGSETITYHNRSPHTLRYLWLQIEANYFHPDGEGRNSNSDGSLGRMSSDSLKDLLRTKKFDGSADIQSVKDAYGNDLDYTIVKTMMRVDLPRGLASGETFTFSVSWKYQINDSSLLRARTGFEFFEEDGNYIYEMAHWFPRLAAYTDYQGWQHKQFVGSGEFTLEFGDYLVRITAPDDHVVAATGVLQNPAQVLSDDQIQRLEDAKSAEKPVFVVTPEEAKANESTKPESKKTWVYHATNVRDFAWASSRKFIWDAWQHNVNGNKVMAMSYYPNEAEPLWSTYSTQSIVHTLDVYSRYTFTYPYPIAISVNGPVGGMEYPMICFNGPRPEKDGTYSAGTKYGLISVIIHEVGHNFFPMIVNSDERQWTWMDEGLNTFLQYLSEQEWEEDYPSRRGEPSNITGYMSSSYQVPIMTDSESVLQFGNNAYGKPATALNILRETILGRELFDFAFKEYAQRWKFKRPNPADFFRTIEDASGIDLDWFWRGWFYTTDHTDISVEGIREFKIETEAKALENPKRQEERDSKPVSLSAELNQPLPKRVDAYPYLSDFYNTYDALAVTEADEKDLEEFLKKLSEEEKAFLDNPLHFYLLDFKNLGGLVMPILVELTFEDGTTEEHSIPALIWRKNSGSVSKLFITEKPIASVKVDPRQQTADTNLDNNIFPREIQQSRFQVFKANKSSGNGPSNPMRRAREAEEKRKKEEAKKAEEEAKAAEDAANAVEAVETSDSEDSEDSES
jgi:hypothetical protein